MDYRIHFSKTGPLIYISHLDLNHTFIRALNRADLKMKYSEGFNPHPKIVFGLPLSVGCAGENEIVDISLADDSLSNNELYLKLKDFLPEHLEIKSVSLPTEKLKNISHAIYKAVFDGNTDKIQEIKNILSQSIEIIKKTKSGEKLIDIKNQIRSFEVVAEDKSCILILDLDASSDSYLNPEYVIKALFERGIPETAYSLSRQEILF